MPLAALYKARIIRMFLLGSRWYTRDLVNAFLVHVNRHCYGLLQHLELAHDSHDLHRCRRRIHVGSLNLRLMNFGIGGNPGYDIRVRVFEVAVSLFRQNCFVGEVDYVELSDGGPALLNVSIGRDLERQGGVERDGSSRARANGITLGGD